MLYHDNAPAHASLLIREFLTKHETTVVPQPPYSPDLAPTDFFLFPKLKSSLKGRRFQTVEEIEENSIRDLRAIPQNTFQDAFQNWKKRWARCIKSGGMYFEGDKFDYVVSKATNLKMFDFFIDCPRITQFSGGQYLTMYKDVTYQMTRSKLAVLCDTSKTSRAEYEACCLTV